MSCFIFHNWGKWEVVEGTSSFFGRNPVAVTRQMRECKDCGKVQVERL